MGISKMESTSDVLQNYSVGGFFVNIDPGLSKIHRDDCPIYELLDATKKGSGIYHTDTYEEAVSLMDSNNEKVLYCENCATV